MPQLITLEEVQKAAQHKAGGLFYFADPYICGRVNSDGSITISQMRAVDAESFGAIVTYLAAPPHSGVD